MKLRFIYQYIVVYRLDGVSTNLNISGSHDSCALDCPTTDEGCVQATCCQNTNKVSFSPELGNRVKVFLLFGIWKYAFGNRPVCVTPIHHSSISESFIYIHSHPSAVRMFGFMIYCLYFVSFNVLFFS